MLYSYLNNHSQTLKALKWQIVKCGWCQNKDKQAFTLYQNGSGLWDTPAGNKTGPTDLPYMPITEYTSAACSIKRHSYKCYDRGNSWRIDPSETTGDQHTSDHSYGKNHGSDTWEIPTVFIVSFQADTDLREIYKTTKLCHCIVQWERYKAKRPIQQCFNYQQFGHSSAYCGRPAKCVKSNKPHTTQDCQKLQSELPNLR